LVERRSPKPEVVGSSPSAPAKIIYRNMKNPLKFIQEVKQEAFRITWPTKKDTLTGGLMVFGLASIAAIFFLILDQILRFLLNLVLTISF
jgi:preprotein translocase subunit SecE